MTKLSLEYLEQEQHLMAKWEDFYSYVRPNVQGCPLSLVDNAIRSAAIELCEKSHIWNVETLCGDLIAMEARYTYAPKDPNIAIVEPLQCVLRDTRPGREGQVHFVEKTTRADLDTYNREWRLQKDEFPTQFFCENPDFIRLVGEPTHDIDDGVHVLLACKPARNSTEVPNFLFETWAETIADGALARLHSMASRVWAKPELMTHHRKNFIAGLSRAKSKNWKSWMLQSTTAITSKNSTFFA